MRGRKTCGDLFQTVSIEGGTRSKDTDFSLFNLLAIFLHQYDITLNLSDFVPTIMNGCLRKILKRFSKK